MKTSAFTVFGLLLTAMVAVSCVDTTPPPKCPDAGPPLVTNSPRKTVLLIDQSRSTLLSPEDSLKTLEQNRRTVQAWLRDFYRFFGDELEVYAIHNETRNGYSILKKQRNGDNFPGAECYTDSLYYLNSRLNAASHQMDSLLENAMNSKFATYSDIWGIIPLMARISENADSVNFCIISDMKEEPQPQYRNGLCFRDMSNPGQEIRRQEDAAPAVAKDIPCIESLLIARNKWGVLAGDRVQILCPQKRSDPFAGPRLEYWRILLHDSLQMRVSIQQED